MREYIHDEDALGHQVDAWLAALRTQGLSDRRVRELAGLLGKAMGEGGPGNAAEARVLRRFEGWRQTSSGWAPPA